MSAILQALDERGAKWADLPFSADELGEILSCVVCTEPYYGGDSSRLPHETCIHGHTCCVDCYTRLTRGQAHTVTCPMCRTTTETPRGSSSTSGPVGAEGAEGPVGPMGAEGP